MNRLAAVAALAAFASFAALVSASAQPAPAPPGQRGITRDAFVQRAAEMAGRRFDAIDVNHAGVITRDQIRAWRQAHADEARGLAQ